MAQGQVESINELHNGSIIRLKIDVEKARAIFELWKIECACGAGAYPADCPGPPTTSQVVSVLAWIDADCKSEIPDYWPLREVNFWDNCIERDAIL